MLRVTLISGRPGQGFEKWNGTEWDKMGQFHRKSGARPEQTGPE